MPSPCLALQFFAGAPVPFVFVCSVMPIAMDVSNSDSDTDGSSSSFCANDYATDNECPFLRPSGGIESKSKGWFRDNGFWDVGGGVYAGEWFNAEGWHEKFAAEQIGQCLTGHWGKSAAGAARLLEAFIDTQEQEYWRRKRIGHSAAQETRRETEQTWKNSVLGQRYLQGKGFWGCVFEKMCSQTSDDVCGAGATVLAYDLEVTEATQSWFDVRFICASQAFLQVSATANTPEKLFHFLRKQKSAGTQSTGAGDAGVFDVIEVRSVADSVSQCRSYHFRFASPMIEDLINELRVLALRSASLNGQFARNRSAEAHALNERRRSKMRKALVDRSGNKSGQGDEAADPGHRFSLAAAADRKQRPDATSEGKNG